jgi:hypothetical protein
MKAKNDKVPTFFYVPNFFYVFFQKNIENVGTLLFLPGFFERSIFQTFWKDDCGAKFLLFELAMSNFGYLLIFQFS